MKRYNKGDKVVSKKYFDIDINGYLTQICEGDIGTVDWDSGEPEIDVYFGDYVRLSVGREDIESCDSEPEEEITIDGFVAKDKEDNELNIFSDKPTSFNGQYWIGDNGCLRLPVQCESMFKNLDCESVQEVTITIKPKKQ